MSDNTNKELVKHTGNNPAFEYVENKYGIDCINYSKLSKTINAHSIAAAKEFAIVLNKKPNEDVTHFFFDYFLNFYVSVKHDQFHFDNSDAFSAIIDGMHIEYYGNVSNETIDDIVGLGTSNINCFLKTNMASLKNKNTADRLRLSVCIAAYCIDRDDILRASEVPELMTQFKFIQNSKLSNIDTFFQIFNKS